MYTGNPSTNPIDALRLEFGDTDDLVIWLTDNDYQYYIDRYTTNTKLRNREILLALLSKLAITGIRERSGAEERYGKDAFDNYFALIKEKLRNPALGNILPISYFGGVYREDKANIATDPRLVPQPFYRNQNDGRADWQGYREYKAFDKVVEPEENDLLIGDFNLGQEI